MAAGTMRAGARPTARGAAMAALVAAVALFGASSSAQPAAAPAPAASASGPVLRPQAFAPLSAAQGLIRDGKHAEALAKIAEAEALPDASADERYIALRLKAAALFGKGDAPAALTAFESVLANPLLPPSERGAMQVTAIKIAIQAKDYARAARWLGPYFADGGDDAELRRLQPQVLALAGDSAGAVRIYERQIADDEAAGRTPAEATLRALAAAQGEAKDMAGYAATVARLAGATGKAEYWNDAITRAVQRPGFAAERQRLNLYRLKRAVGLPLSAGELGDMAQRASQAGLPAEAQALLDEGFAAGTLGKDANAAADTQLRAQATKAAAGDRAGFADAEGAALKARDGNAAFNLGMAMAGAGMHDKAAALMAAGIAKGGLRSPDDAWLHLGVAQWHAGKTDDALASFAKVKGSDGGAELARLWTLHLKGTGAAGPRRTG